MSALVCSNCPIHCLEQFDIERKNESQVVIGSYTIISEMSSKITSLETRVREQDDLIREQGIQIKICLERIIKLEEKMRTKI
jgi:hypothetical protein